jgi:hypothetical protein
MKLEKYRVGIGIACTFFSSHQDSCPARGRITCVHLGRIESYARRKTLMDIIKKEQNEYLKLLQIMRVIVTQRRAS